MANSSAEQKTQSRASAPRHVTSLWARSRQEVLIRVVCRNADLAFPESQEFKRTFCIMSSQDDGNSVREMALISVFLAKAFPRMSGFVECPNLGPLPSVPGWLASNFIASPNLKPHSIDNSSEWSIG